MNFKAGIPAWKWLQTCRTPGELASVIYENGEVRCLNLKLRFGETERIIIVSGLNIQNNVQQHFG